MTEIDQAWGDTWDDAWNTIAQSCERQCGQFQAAIDGSGTPNQMQKMYLQSAQGLIAVIGKLRVHPQMGELVPTKSMLSLRWSPTADHEVALYCVRDGSQFSISLIRKERIEDEKIVGLDEAADELYRYLSALLTG